MQHLSRIIGFVVAGGMTISVASYTSAQCIVQELHSDGSVPHDAFSAVASAGDLLVVGDINDFSQPARAFIHRRISGVWTLEAVLHDPLQDIDSLYYRPATNGEFVFVSATGVFGDGYSGIVHVYRQSTEGWLYDSLLHPPEGSEIKHFGFAMDMQGGTAVICAPRTVVRGMERAGAALVYRCDQLNHRWTHVQTLYASTPAAEDLFGRSVRIQGNVIIVGAPGVNQNRGAAYVFRWNGREWMGEGELLAPDAGFGDEFGYSVGATASLATVGALDAEDGKVYTFVHRDRRWMHESTLMAQTPSKPSYWFGGTLAMTSEGSTLLIGAYDSFGAFEAGAGFIFRRVNGIWTQTGKIGDPTPNPTGDFSAALVINGDQAFINAYNGGPNGNGVVFVFDGIHQRDCNGDGIVDACEGIAGPNWDVTPTSCTDLADLDGDGVVGPADLQLVLSAWGPCSCTADLDADGTVDGFDLAYLLGSWGPVQSK